MKIVLRLLLIICITTVQVSSELTRKPIQLLNANGLTLNAEMLSVNTMKENVGRIHAKWGKSKDVISNSFAENMFYGPTSFLFKEIGNNSDGLNMFIAADFNADRLVCFDTYKLNENRYRIKKFCLPSWLGGGCAIDMTFNFPQITYEGSRGTGNAQFDHPRVVISDWDGGTEYANIWVADAGNNRISRLRYTHGAPNSTSGNFTQDGSIDGFSGILDIAYFMKDGEEFLLATDAYADRVVVLPARGWGNDAHLVDYELFFYNGDDCGGLSKPSSICTDKNMLTYTDKTSEYFFIADENKHRIVKVALDDTKLIFAGDVVLENDAAPNFVRTDKFGTVYASDKESSKIHVLAGQDEWDISEEKKNWLYSVGKPGTASTSSDIQFYELQSLYNAGEYLFATDYWSNTTGLQKFDLRNVKILDRDYIVVPSGTGYEALVNVKCDNAFYAEYQVNNDAWVTVGGTGTPQLFFAGNNNTIPVPLTGTDRNKTIKIRVTSAWPFSVSETPSTAVTTMEMNVSNALFGPQNLKFTEKLMRKSDFVWLSPAMSYSERNSSFEYNKYFLERYNERRSWQVIAEYPDLAYEATSAHYVTCDPALQEGIFRLGIEYTAVDNGEEMAFTTGTSGIIIDGNSIYNTNTGAAAGLWAQNEIAGGNLFVEMTMDENCTSKDFFVYKDGIVQPLAEVRFENDGTFTCSVSSGGLTHSSGANAYENGDIIKVAYEIDSWHFYLNSQQVYSYSETVSYPCKFYFNFDDFGGAFTNCRVSGDRILNASFSDYNSTYYSVTGNSVQSIETQGSCGMGYTIVADQKLSSTEDGYFEFSLQNPLSYWSYIALFSSIEQFGMVFRSESAPYVELTYEDPADHIVKRITQNITGISYPANVKMGISGNKPLVIINGTTVFQHSQELDIPSTRFGIYLEEINEQVTDIKINSPQVLTFYSNEVEVVPDPAILEYHLTPSDADRLPEIIQYRLPQAYIILGEGNYIVNNPLVVSAACGNGIFKIKGEHCQKVILQPAHPDLPMFQFELPDDNTIEAKISELTIQNVRNIGIEMPANAVNRNTSIHNVIFNNVETALKIPFYSSNYSLDDVIEHNTFVDCQTPILLHSDAAVCGGGGVCERKLKIRNNVIASNIMSPDFILFTGTCSAFGYELFLNNSFSSNYLTLPSCGAGNDNRNTGLLYLNPFCDITDIHSSAITLDADENIVNVRGAVPEIDNTKPELTINPQMFRRADNGRIQYLMLEQTGTAVIQAKMNEYGKIAYKNSFTEALFTEIEGNTAQINVIPNSVLPLYCIDNAGNSSAIMYTSFPSMVICDEKDINSFYLIAPANVIMDNTIRKTGSLSYKMPLDGVTSNTVSFIEPLPVVEYCRSISFWVRRSRVDQLFDISFVDASGNSHVITNGVLGSRKGWQVTTNGTDWEYIEVEFSSEQNVTTATSLKGKLYECDITVSSSVNGTAGDAVWLDDLRINEADMAIYDEGLSDKTGRGGSDGWDGQTSSSAFTGAEALKITIKTGNTASSDSWTGPLPTNNNRLNFTCAYKKSNGAAVAKVNLIIEDPNTMEDITYTCQEVKGTETNIAAGWRLPYHNDTKWHYAVVSMHAIAGSFTQTPLVDNTYNHTRSPFGKIKRVEFFAIGTPGTEILYDDVKLTTHIAEESVTIYNDGVPEIITEHRRSPWLSKENVLQWKIEEVGEDLSQSSLFSEVNGNGIAVEVNNNSFRLLNSDETELEEINNGGILSKQFDYTNASLEDISIQWEQVDNEPGSSIELQIKADDDEIYPLYLAPNLVLSEGQYHKTWIYMGRNTPVYTTNETFCLKPFKMFSSIYHGKVPVMFVCAKYNRLINTEQRDWVPTQLSNFNLIEDITAPVATFVSPTVNGFINGKLTFNGAADAEVTMITYTITGKDDIVIYSGEKEVHNTAFNFDVTIPNFDYKLLENDQSCNVIIGVFDEYGNKNEYTYTMIFDNRPPVVQIIEPKIDPVNTGILPVTVHVSEQIKIIDYLIYNTFDNEQPKLAISDTLSSDIRNIKKNIDLATLDPADFPDGKGIVRIVVTDMAGNKTVYRNEFILVPPDTASFTHNQRIQLELNTTNTNILSQEIRGFPLLIRLDSLNFHFSEVRNDGRDITFTDSYGNFLPVEIEEFDPVRKIGVLWVGINKVSAGDLGFFITMHWGNDNSFCAPNPYLVWDQYFTAVYHLNNRDWASAMHAVYSLENTVIGDRTKVKNGSVGSNTMIGLGASVKIEGDLQCDGNISLNTNDTINGNIKLNGTLETVSSVIISGAVDSVTEINLLHIPEKNEITTGNDSVIVPCNASYTIFPGLYSKIHVFSSSILTITPGVYNCKQFIIEPDVVINFDSPTTGTFEINVSDSLSFGDRDTMVYDVGNGYVFVDFYSNQKNALRIGADSKIVGSFTAPFAEVAVSARTKMLGALYARSIRTEPDVVFTTATQFNRIIPYTSELIDATINRRKATTCLTISRPAQIANGREYVDDSSSIDITKMVIGNKFTISAWVKRKYEHVEEYLCTTGDWVLGFDELNRLYFNGSATITGSQTIIADGFWHFISLVHDGQSVKMYIDGNLDVIGTDLQTYTGDEKRVWVGKTEAEGAGYNGFIDELQFSATPRSPNWIKFAYETQKFGHSIASVKTEGPEEVSIGLNEDGKISLSIPYIEGISRYEIQRRITGEVNWTTIPFTFDCNGKILDEYIRCGTSYEYRARYVYESHVSGWSPVMTIKTVRCDLNATSIVIKTMLRNDNSDYDDEELNNFSVILYDIPINGVALATENLQAFVKGGWVELPLVSDDVYNAIKSNNNLYAEVIVNGNRLPERIPVTGTGSGCITNSNMLNGTRDPVGIYNSDPGSIYFNITTKSIFIKYGNSKFDWKLVE